ncbi:MAG: DNA repair protein RadC [Sediminibacterium sp.]
MEKNTIKQWAADDQPRKKLLLKGTEALSNTELLAILINSGTPQRSAIDLARELLKSNGNDLKKLASLSVKDLVKCNIKGLKEAKAITIIAALELGIRRNAACSKKDTITHSADVAHYLRARLEFKKQEVFSVVFLNSANKIIHFEVISEGGISGTVADPRVILKKTLEQNATSIILCHNHPSGSLQPSRADELLTQKIKAAASYLDVKVVDHIIVSEEGYFSFADEGRL